MRWSATSCCEGVRDRGSADRLLVFEVVSFVGFAGEEERYSGI